MATQARETKDGFLSYSYRLNVKTPQYSRLITFLSVLKEMAGFYV